MLNIEEELAALRAIESPLERESAARQAAERARELLEAISGVRAEAVKEVYDVFGGTKTSRLFGINRVALYRIIEPVRTEQEKQARAAKWAIAAEALLTIAMSGSSARQDGLTGDHEAIEGGENHGQLLEA